MKVLSISPLGAIARGLTILFMVFTATFALDSINETRSLTEMMPDFFMHLLPTIVILAIFLLSFRWEWVATIGFCGLAIVYGAVSYKHPDWVLVIAAPLFVLGILYFIAWRQRKNSVKPIHPQI